MSDRMVTVVLLLKGGHTGMQVLGFEPYIYPGVGSGSMFPGVTGLSTNDWAAPGMI